MTCELCGCEVEHLEKHHLIPKKKIREKSPVAFVCRMCGDQIHILFTNKELAKRYNTIEKLLEDERVKKYIEWKKKKCGDKKLGMKLSNHCKGKK